MSWTTFRPLYECSFSRVTKFRGVSFCLSVLFHSSCCFSCSVWIMHCISTWFNCVLTGITCVFCDNSVRSLYANRCPTTINHISDPNKKTTQYYNQMDWPQNTALWYSLVWSVQLESSCLLMQTFHNSQLVLFAFMETPTHDSSLLWSLSLSLDCFILWPGQHWIFASKGLFPWSH